MLAVLVPNDALKIGSGSTYVYGFCDATYRDGWGREKTVEFVKNSKELCFVVSELIFIASAFPCDVEGWQIGRAHV